MNKSAQTQLVIGAIVLIILVIGAFFLFSGDDTSNDTTQEVPVPDSDVDETVVINDDETTAIDETQSSEHAIDFTSSGYAPNSITINKGDTVIFVNKEDALTWPASNIHPTHRVYPNSDISKCGTSEKNDIFDACRGLQKDETYSFTFNEIGVWSYHDHLSPGKKGTITVQ